MINDCNCSEKKMLCHVVMVEHFWMTTNQNIKVVFLRIPTS